VAPYLSVEHVTLVLLTLSPTYLSCVIAVNSMIFAALTTGKIAQVSFLVTTPGRSSFLLDRDDVPLSALKPALNMEITETSSKLQCWNRCEGLLDSENGSPH
jgi:hypothetical protein